MGPLVLINVALVGVMAFAALHYAYLWWLSRRERVLLVFSLFSLQLALVSAGVARILTATSTGQVQTALDLRTSVGILMLPAMVWLASQITGVRARGFVTGVIVFFVSVSALNLLGLPLNGTVLAIQRIQMSWGEDVTIFQRDAAGWWVVPVYVMALAAQSFTIVAGAVLWRRDRGGGFMVIVIGAAALFGTILAGLTDVVRLPLPYVANLAYALWVPLLALLLSREYARRAERVASSETERREAEKALTASGATYRTLIESAPEAIVVLDLTAGGFADANQNACELFGVSMAELRTLSPVDVSPPTQPDGRSSREAVAAYLRQAVAGGKPVFEWTHRTSGGRETPCEVRLVRLPDATRILIRGSITDISERKRAERELRDIQSRHSAILESSLDGLIVVDSQSRILEFNSVAETIFGHRRQDVVGQDLAGLLIPHNLREAHYHGMQRYLSTRAGSVIGRRLEMPALRSDGTEVRVELSIQPIAGLEPPLFAGVVRDITERLRLEEQLRQSQKMEAIGQLAGGVAHDFNNLLTVIAGYGELLQTRLAGDHELWSHARSIADAGERAAALTQRLLAFSRQSVLEPRVLNINTVVSDTERMLRRLIGEDILLEVSLDGQAKPVRIDPGLMGQVVMNLALNARDALPTGGALAIETSNVTLDGQAGLASADVPPGKYVRLVVRDNGCGIAPDIRDRIFEPFFTTKGVGKGTGLGLAVVHGIVKQSGGYITVDSEPGAGATFAIYLPAADAVPTEIERPEPPVTTRGVETILLVEDEEAVRALEELALQRQGFNVLTAADGAEALRLVREHRGPIDLLATDVVMPNMSGRDLADRLRSEYAGLKVLFLSGYTDDTLLRHGVFGGHEAFLQKPFALTTFARKVREVLDRK